MPKKTKHPRLRTYIKRGKSGQAWVSYAYDMRGTGQRDIPLGTDYDAAVAKWDELHHQKNRVAGTIEEAFARYERDVLPNVLELEHADAYPTAMVEQMREFGLFGATIPRSYGGLGCWK